MENEEIIENEDIIDNEDIEPTPEPEPFVIPLIYNYNPDTKEFTGEIEQADKDNAKSAQVGYFVPMVHANATLLEPPECEENQIQVYSKTYEVHPEPYEVIDYKTVTEEYDEPIYNEETGEIDHYETRTREIQLPDGSHIEYKDVTEVIENWTIEADYRKNFYKVDDNLNVYDITTIGGQDGFYIVTKEVGEDIKANKDWYKISDNEVVKKSTKEYNKEQKARREAEFNKAFFNTSLGYIRRSVTMADGSHKDFLSDLLPVISMGVQGGQSVNILTYDKPTFDKDVTDWTEYQHQEVVTPQFIQECFMQLSNDFLPINEE